MLHQNWAFLSRQCQDLNLCFDYSFHHQKYTHGITADDENATCCNHDINDYGNCYFYHKSGSADRYSYSYEYCHQHEYNHKYGDRY